MNNKTKTLLGVGIFALVLIIAAFSYNALSDRFSPQTSLNDAGDHTSGAEDDEEETIAAPDFTVYDYDGNAVKLSDYFGKPIVLNFWASWCSPCKNEMPHFNKVYEELNGDVLFLMVDLVDGVRETPEKGRRYMDDSGYSFTVLFDVDQDAAYTYGVRSIPSTTFINAEGDIVAGVEGSIDEDTLLKGIELIK